MKKKDRIKDNPSWLFIIFLSFIPILLWLLTPTSVPRFSSGVRIMTSMGQVLALVGMSMFALNFILSARLKFLEKYFGGLSRVYDNHAKLGQIALILLLFHPLFLIPKYTGGANREALKFLLPVNGWAQNFGQFALELMVILIVLALYLRPRYDIWKLTHKLLGLAMLLALLHFSLIPSDVTNFLPLRIYLSALTATALVFFIYRSLLARFLVEKYDYIVTRVKKLSPMIVEIVMKPKSKAMDYRPGQFVFSSFESDKVRSEEHPFSLTSFGSDEISIAVKKSGDFTKNLDKLTAGDKVKIEGAFGYFNFHRGVYKKQIWIAGGIGIAPFVSMAKALADDNDYRADLVYSVHDEDEAIYATQLARVSSNLKVTIYNSGKFGHLDVDKLQKMTSISGKSIFICAPVPMIRALRRQLLDAGIGGKLIHTEEFDFG